MALYKRDILEIRKLRSRATAKIARANRTLGVSISGGEYDPRLSPKIDELKKMSRKELNKYKQTLRDFNSRSNNIKNNFYAGAHGRAVSKTVWDSYKAVEDDFNALNNEKYSRYNDVMSRAGMTYRDRMLSRRGVTLDTDMNLSYYGTKRDMKGFPSDKAILKRQKVLEQRLDGEYYQNKHDQYKENFLAMLENDPKNNKFYNVVKNMGYDQFVMLSDLPGVWDKVATRYRAWKEGRSLDWLDELDDDIGDEIGHILNHAYPELRRKDAEIAYGGKAI